MAPTDATSVTSGFGCYQFILVESEAADSVPHRRNSIARLAG